MHEKGQFRRVIQFCAYSQIAAKDSINTNLRNLQRIIHDCKYLKSEKLEIKSPSSDKHKKVRLYFFPKIMFNVKKWRVVIVTDKKK